ncbi:MAG: GntR family transcriptional regulator, transcriptional repressor for pyruvate dehydrogenase complex [Chloroflexota bacterium]|nr:GntR family transcriptional regulator, transcriptional repressor for pyruvate dehydrogenase complex [Chloroflexota bacterium]
MTSKNLEHDVKLAPVETRRASEAIYDQIKDMIISGELKPGDRLPSERNMMEMMQRSRPPIREALRMLEGSGFIHTIPGSGGAVVRQMTSASVEEPLENMITLNQISHAELLEYRELNEVAFAGWSAERRTTEDLAALAACLESAESATDDLDAFITTDIKFHELLTASAHNGVLSIVNRVLSRIILDLLRTRLHEYPVEESRRMCREILKMHQEIYKAVAAQDSAGAQDLMHHHLERFRDDLSL